MQAPFDIAADLDTPVSAYLKLGALQPRFLLESVEGGERLARYSFLGFGEALEVRMDADALYVDGEVRSRPTDQEEYLNALRGALAAAPKPGPEVEGLPFAGGLVGVSGYDVVRLFEKLPSDTTAQSSIPDAAFVAPASLLVFDHLTRRVALLHDGPEGERKKLRGEVIRLLRGAIPASNGKVTISQPEASFSEAEFCARVDACKEYIASGDIYQIVMSVLFRGRSDVAPFEVYRALRLLNPSPYMFFFEFGDLKVVGSSPEALVKLNGQKASLRPIAGTLPRGTNSEEDLANEVALLPIQKKRPSMSCSSTWRVTTLVVLQKRARYSSNHIVRSSATVMSCTSSVACRANSRVVMINSTSSRRAFLPELWLVRPKFAPWRSSRKWNLLVAVCMLVPLAILD